MNTIPEIPCALAHNMCGGVRCGCPVSGKLAGESDGRKVDVTKVTVTCNCNKHQ